MFGALEENIKGIFHAILDFIKMIIRQIRSIRLNRNLLMFLVFLAISATLWFIQTAMETLTATIEYRVQVVNAPDNIIYTSDVHDTIKVHVSAKGSTYYWHMLHYLTRRGDQMIPVEYKDVDRTSSQIIISNIILKRNIQRYLGKDFQVLSVTPSQLSTYYTAGKAKKLPIVFDGKLNPGAQRLITGISMSPKYVEAYLPASLYDSVKVVHADCEKLDTLLDPISVRVALKKIDNVKLVPDSVTMKIDVCVWSTKELSARIYPVNFPSNISVKFFPEKVNLTFRTVAKRYNYIADSNFSIVVDYNQMKPGDKYCNVILAGQPDDVTNVQYKPNKVQYVIEPKGKK